MKSCRGLIVIATFLVIAAPTTLPASDGANTSVLSQPNWGLGNSIVHTIGAFGFMPHTSGQAWTTNGYRYMYQTAGPGYWGSPLVLPAGSRIVALELEGCDETATGELLMWLSVCPHRGAYVCSSSPLYSTGLTETPGCGGFFLSIDPPITVDNLTNTYFIEVFLGENTWKIRFLSVLVSYQLQISPAPIDPTFPDVSPSYWAFQEIEALAASGITTGFPDGTFRPTAAVTRAQMATFLARALGLHWPY